MAQATPYGRSHWTRALAIRTRRLIVCLILATGLLTPGCQTDGQRQPFPDRPIEIIIYTKPGGPIDVTVRKFIEVAEKYATGVTFVPKIKSGAGGIVAMGHVLQKKPDGYTLLGCTKSNIAKVVSSGRKDVDQFDWIGMLLIDPECVIIRNTDPPTSWDALVSDARQRPGKQVWVGPAAGGLDHVVAQQIWEGLGIDCVWSAFDSGKDALAAVRRGEGDAYVGNPAEVTGYPNLQVAAVSSPQRLAHLPGTPTFSERGLKGLDHEIMWRGFAIKKGCPDDALAFYDDLFRKVTQDAEWRSHWEKYGMEVLYRPQADFEKVVAKDARTFAKYQSSGPPAAGSRWLLAFSGCVLALIVAFWLTSKQDLGKSTIPLGVIGVCTAFVALSANFPDGKGIGPAAFPRSLSVVICWLAVAAITQQPHTTPRSIERRPGQVGWLVTTLVVYLVATIVFGYVVSTGLFLVYQMRALGERRTMVIVSASIGWLVFAYVVFDRILTIPLPNGMIWSLFA